MEEFQFIKYKGFDHVFKYSGPWLWWLIGFYLCLPVLAYILLPYLTLSGTISGKRRTVSIFVLGDLGHSPRMCYHARSFSRLDYYVNLCGYLEEQPPFDIIDDINIDIYPITVVKNTKNLPFILFAAKKMVVQFVQLLKLLLDFRGTDYILIQNPPSIPILLIVLAYIKIFSRRTELIIDWHNLNYTILNLKFQNLKHPLVRILRIYERLLGQFADYNITVTKQMKEFLIKEFNFNKKRIITLHDRPGEQFKPLKSLALTKQDILEAHDIFKDVRNISNYKILVSSTSFTPDEDFNLLLNALDQYDKSLVEKKLPPILIIITGKGPLKNQFLQKVKQLNLLDNVIIKNAWLSSEDYPLVLSVADLSISLHTSSSGIDLPMKIVDFFGCGIPVITLYFPAIGELVKHRINGLITKSDKDSSVNESQEIYRLLTEAFTNEDLLDRIKQGALNESNLRWEENWNNKLGKLFEYFTD
mmetsp:Transcript_9409/g.11707  ORF Transcript_9409/g.11707 Transcript_9409/m.11707 type:complete len:473 (+) Transcript_9409:165-1583(+)